MYHLGGVAYVYLCYGIHHLFNIVTKIEGIPHAILIRGIQPEKGIPYMLKRRNKTQINRQLTGEPGTVSQALVFTLHIPELC
jgi:DNA-3-methyladenine glycosylase